MTRTKINPDLIRWAINRSGIELTGLKTRFPKIDQWIEGEVFPTTNQLASLAKATLTPYGYFFLPSPPVESLPVPDFRTVRDRGVKRTSAALLETIYAMQRRQEWLRDYLIEEEEEPIPFINTITLNTDPKIAAGIIRDSLGMVDGWADNQGRHAVNSDVTHFLTSQRRGPQCSAKGGFAREQAATGIVFVVSPRRCSEAGSHR